MLLLSGHTHLLRVMNKIDYLPERDREFAKVYFSMSVSADDTWVSRCLKAIKQPASRFFISEEEANKVINKILSGRRINRTGNKARLVHDLFKTFLDIYENNRELSKAEAIHLAVNSPAPEFYLSPRSAMRILKNSRKWLSCRKF